jgi:hypothetical protein
VPSEGPPGLWLDRRRLFSAADAALVLLDRDNGALLKSLPLPGVPDVVGRCLCVFCPVSGGAAVYEERA